MTTVLDTSSEMVEPARAALSMRDSPKAHSMGLTDASGGQLVRADLVVLHAVINNARQNLGLVGEAADHPGQVRARRWSLEPRWLEGSKEEKFKRGNGNDIPR